MVSTMTFQLSFEEKPHPDDIQVLSHGIMDHAQKKKGFNPLEFFAFFIRDSSNAVVGGCNGCTLYGCLFIDQLWVSDSLRNQGWGTQLMRAALSYGEKKGCTFATVNTMDWEALGFYQKLGFKIEFARHGFQKNSVFYFLRKEFLETAAQQDQINIRPLAEKDIMHLVDEFARHLWPKPRSTFDPYWHEQAKNERCIWLAFYNKQLAGYVTLRWHSDYQPFRDNHIPEIMDLNVLPPYRNKGIGSQLLAIAEKEAASRCDVVGLGVGLYRDYGAAQKLYIKRGYTPDGRGLTYQYRPINPGDNAPVDDDLILWFTKQVNLYI